MRSATIERTTVETAVRVHLTLEGVAPSTISTVLAMFDHLLGAFALHGGLTLDIDARSKDAIAHHLVEDVAIVLGTALGQAAGSRGSIARYGDALLPMDDALVRCAIDAGGRTYARVDLRLKHERIEDLAADMIPHFFSSLATNAGFTLHLDALAGINDHHVAEAAFKAAARATRAALSLRSGEVLSTKGVL